MILPSLLLDVAFGVDPPAVPDPADWVDLSARIRPEARGGVLAQVQRPRGQELRHPDAATAQVTLDNLDRALDPRNTSSPYHPGVDLQRPARLRAAWQGHTIDLFTGFVDRWDAPLDQPADAYTVVPLVDALAWLAGVDVTVDLPAHTTGERIAAVLDAAGWPEGLRDIDPGLVVVDPVEREDDALSIIRDAAEAEDGVLWAAADGKVTFRDRHARLDLTPTLTLDAGDLAGVRGSWSREMLYTVARGEMSDGRTVGYADPDAISHYGRRVWDIRDQETTIQEAEGSGMWVVHRYGRLHEQLEPITVDAYHQIPTSQFVTFVRLTFGDRVDVTRPHPSGGPADELELVVDEIEHTITPTRWDVVHRYTPYHGEGPWLTLDDETLGLLDGDNQLAP